MELKPIQEPLTIGNDTFDKGYIAYSDGGYVCAIVEKYKNKWRVWRVATTHKQELILGGIDEFDTYEDSLRWLKSNVWK